MFSSRELFIVAATVITTLGVVSIAQDAKPEPKIMGSSIFDWTQISVKKNPKRGVAKVLPGSDGHT